MTGVLSDPLADPAGFVLVACEQVETDAGLISVGSPAVRVLPARPESAEWLVDMLLAQAALWRSIAERHASRSGKFCQWCAGGTAFAVWPCPDLLAVVAACRAYAGDAQ